MSKYAEYLICKKRGHQARNKTWGSDGTWEWQICKHCDTKYGYIKELREADTPEPNTEDLQSQDNDLPGLEDK